MTKIKICGLRRIQDVDYVNSCKPDFAGFVFAESKRKVTIEQTVELKSHLAKEIIPVGVFVNEQIEKVAKLLNEGIIDIAQLHGDEDKAYISRLRKQMKRGKLIKAIRVASMDSLIDCQNIDVDYLLFDTFSFGEYGGTGRQFDWNLISGIKKPFFLAGGIDSDNVLKAIKEVQPFGVDVSSAVETNGFKDKEKIIEIVTKVKNSK